MAGLLSLAKDLPGVPAHHCLVTLYTRTSLILDQCARARLDIKTVSGFTYYNATSLSSVAKIRAIHRAAGRIKFLVVALQESKARRSGVRQMNDGTLVIRAEHVPSQNGAGGVDFVVHPSVLHCPC
ncbi:hypothetical protein RB195_022591 [Necator americanus]|uniref:Uncharacterized protein n=1 Tax=Necator americanus TaxID=51031 RepID=A0ABR1EFW5_NECAM